MVRTEQESAVGHPVTAHTADGKGWGRGMVVSYTDTPSFQIERPDGSRFSWRADMCERDDEFPALTMVDFLRARLAEDEHNARDGGIGRVPMGCYATDRVLAEVAAKRRIVDECTYTGAGGETFVVCAGPGGDVDGESVLRLLALPHADHPDYREEWKP